MLQHYRLHLSILVPLFSSSDYVCFPYVSYFATFHWKNRLLCIYWMSRSLITRCHRRWNQNADAHFNTRMIQCFSDIIGCKMLQSKTPCNILLRQGIAKDRIGYNYPIISSCWSWFDFYFLACQHRFTASPEACTPEKQCFEPPPRKAQIPQGEGKCGCLAVGYCPNLSPLVSRGACCFVMSWRVWHDENMTDIWQTWWSGKVECQSLKKSIQHQQTSKIGLASLLIPCWWLGRSEVFH